MAEHWNPAKGNTEGGRDSITVLLMCSTRCGSPVCNTCCLLPQYRDLPHNAVLAVSVWGLAEAQPLAPLGGTTMRLFSKKVPS